MCTRETTAPDNKNLPDQALSSWKHRGPDLVVGRLGQPICTMHDHSLTDPSSDPSSSFSFTDEERHGVRDLQNCVEPLDLLNQTGFEYSSFRGPNRSIDVVMYKRDWPSNNGDMDIHRPSLQANIAFVPNNNVSYDYNLITPPSDDEALDKRKLPLDQTPETSPLVEEFRGVESAHTHNAANQQPPFSPTKDTDTQSEDKREKARQKNRLAAVKCRSKQKKHADDLEEHVRNAAAYNSQLKQQELQLRNAFVELRNLALMHDPSQGCQCHQIHLYNTTKAREAVRGSVHLPSGLVSSRGSQSYADFDDIFQQASSSNML